MRSPGVVVVSPKLVRTLIIAGIIALVIVISMMLLDVVGSFLDILLMTGLAWLVAFILSPPINYLNRHPIPPAVIDRLRPRLPERVTNRLDRFHLPHAVSVIIVYILVLVVFSAFTFIAVPSLTRFVVDFSKTIPSLLEQLRTLLGGVQDRLSEFGINIPFSQYLEPDELAKQLQSLASSVGSGALSAATGLASMVVNALLLLTVALYLNLDGPRLTRQLHAIIPDHYHGQLNLMGQSVSRTFGGFMQGQMLLGVLYGIPSALVLAIAKVQLFFAIGILTTFLMLIPLIGAPIAMVLPALVAWFFAPQHALWILIVLTVYQQILLQVLAPKLMGDVLGMPSLVVLLAIWVATRVVGLWGLVFGLPVAGVLYALTISFLEQSKIEREALPRVREDDPQGRTFTMPAMGPGCLLVPDMGFHPNEARHIATFMAARGISCISIDPYIPEGSDAWEDWYAAVLLGVDRLWKECNQIIIIGRGIGALLALHAASELPVAAAVAVEPLLRESGRYGDIRSIEIGEGERPSIVDPTRLPEQKLRTEITQLQDRVHAELTAITRPVLLVHFGGEEATEPSAKDMRYVLERVQAPQKRIEWLNEVEDGDDTAEWTAIAQGAYAFSHRLLR